MAFPRRWRGGAGGSCPPVCNSGGGGCTVSSSSGVPPPAGHPSRRGTIGRAPPAVSHVCIAGGVDLQWLCPAAPAASRSQRRGGRGGLSGAWRDCRLVSPWLGAAGLVNRWSSPGWARGPFPSCGPRHSFAWRQSPWTERQSRGPAIIDGVPRAKSPPRRGFACDGFLCLRAGRGRRPARTTIRRSAGRDDETGDREARTLWRKASVTRHQVAVHVAPSVASPTPVGGPRDRRCSCPAPGNLHIGHHWCTDEVIVRWGATVLLTARRVFERGSGSVQDTGKIGEDSSPSSALSPAVVRRRPPAAGRHCWRPPTAHAAAVKRSTQCWRRR